MSSRKEVTLPYGWHGRGSRVSVRGSQAPVTNRRRPLPEERMEGEAKRDIMATYK